MPYSKRHESETPFMVSCTVAIQISKILGKISHHFFGSNLQKPFSLPVYFRRVYFPSNFSCYYVTLNMNLSNETRSVLLLWNTKFRRGTIFFFDGIRPGQIFILQIRPSFWKHKIEWTTLIFLARCVFYEYFCFDFSLCLLSYKI